MSDERGRHRRAGAQPGLRTAAVQGAARRLRGPPQRRPRPAAAGARPRWGHRRHRRPARRGRPRRHRRRPQPRRPGLAGAPRRRDRHLASASTPCRATPTPSASSAPTAHAGLRPGLPARHPRGRRRPGCRAGQHRRPSSPPAAPSRSSSRSACPRPWPAPWPGEFARAQAILERPDGRWGDDDPAPRRFDEPAVRRPARRHRPRHGATSHGVRIFSDLVPSALVDSEADRAALLELEDVASHPRPPAARRPRQRPARPRDPGLTPSGVTDEPPPVRPPDPRLQRAPRRHRLHGAARRHGRLLRVRDAARPPRAASARRSSSAAATAGWCSRPPTRRAASGCTSAMPMSRARRLCPQAIVLPADHAPLRAISRGRSWRSSATVTPVVEPLSLDEAFLDVSGAVRRLGPPATIGQHIRDTVHDEQGITCSVGVAPTKFVAKLASGLAKPDGMVVVPARRRSCRSCSSCRSRRCGGWGSAPRRRCCAWAAHRRRHRPHPAGDPACAGSARPPGTTCTSCRGGATRAGRARAAREEHRQRPDLRLRHRRRRRDPPAPAGAQRAHRGPDARGRDDRGAPSPCGCGSATSRRSPGSRTLREPTDSGRAIHEAAVGLLRRPRACNGPASGSSGCASRSSSRPRRPPSRGSSASPSTAGGTPTGRSTGPAPGSVRGR